MAVQDVRRVESRDDLLLRVLRELLELDRKALFAGVRRHRLLVELESIPNGLTAKCHSDSLFHNQFKLVYFIFAYSWIEKTSIKDILYELGIIFDSKSHSKKSKKKRNREERLKIIKHNEGDAPVCDWTVIPKMVQIICGIPKNTPGLSHRRKQ